MHSTVINGMDVICRANELSLTTPTADSHHGSTPTANAHTAPAEIEESTPRPMSVKKKYTALALAVTCGISSIHAAPTATADTLTLQAQAAPPAPPLPDVGHIIRGLGVVVVLAVLGSLAGGSSEALAGIGTGTGDATGTGGSTHPAGVKPRTKAATITNVDAARDTIRTRINTYRTTNGRDAYIESATLNAQAQEYAETMAAAVAAHGRSEYKHSDLPYAENIHLVRDPMKSCVDGWKKSPDHDRNLLNEGYRWMGFGMAKTPDDEWWTCVALFTGKKH